MLNETALSGTETGAFEKNDLIPVCVPDVIAVKLLTKVDINAIGSKLIYKTITNWLYDNLVMN